MVQHLEALQKANDVRSSNACVKQRIKAMTRDDALRAAIEILLDPTQGTGAIPLNGLLRCIHTIGDSKIDKLCKKEKIGMADRRIRDLTLRQRTALAETLRKLIRSERDHRLGPA